MKRIVAVVACALVLAGCGESTAPEPGAQLRLVLSVAQVEDDRTYGVGRVQLRAIDADEVVLASQIFFIDRETGSFDLDFAVPSGPARRILVEPLGSGILPNGGKTESGVALQGITEPLDLDAGTRIDAFAELFPFIPNRLRLESGNDCELALVWDRMIPAAFHTVRVHEDPITAPPSSDEPRTREVLIPRGNRVCLDELRAPGFAPFGLQVRSENRFAFSAYSDTLFFAIR